MYHFTLFFIITQRNNRAILMGQEQFEFRIVEEEPKESTVRKDMDDKLLILLDKLNF